MAATPPVCDFGWKASDFNLQATSGDEVSLQNIRGHNGTLIMFICNHCPYVMAVLDRIIKTSEELIDLGIGVAAVSSNDVLSFPEDSFENMCLLAKKFEFPFPYLFDETQKVAKKYNAACTPDFFGFNSKLELQYRGRLDAAHKEADTKSVRRDLYEAMKEISITGHGPKEQMRSIGCSIKWKNR